MVGTQLGGRKASMTNRQKYGQDFYRRIGAKGGAVKTPTGGFAANRELARSAGAKGGRNSRRTAKVYDEAWARHYEEIRKLYKNDYSYAEIARKTQIPYSALRIRIQRELEYGNF